ncbi:MAG: hypothetical protein H7124_12845 [Phycisphaerales bacterium]|nr:hypothetical protein [Hyphomonadaceae bacterium]
MARVLETVELDDRGVAYIRTRLSELHAYGPTLAGFCGALKDRMRTINGRAFTTAPAGTRHEQLYAFDSGGLLPENPDLSHVIYLDDGSTLAPIENLFEEEFLRLSDQLSHTPHLVSVAVDPLPRKGDPCLEGYGETIFYVGDDVFHLITTTTSKAAAELALVGSPPWSNLVVLSTVSPKLDASRCADLTELYRCAEAAVEVSCGAYDGEGGVSWRCQMGVSG